MKKIIILFVLLFGFQNVLKAGYGEDRAFDAFLALFSWCSDQSMYRNWEHEKKIEIRGYLRQHLKSGKTLEDFWIKLNALGAAVKILDLGNNRLESVDVSKLTGLKVLDLWGNDISQIDVSRLTQLEKLNLSNNKFSDIDVSKLTQLEELDVSNNKLSDIDVSKLMQLRVLDLSQNKFLKVHVLDLSALEKLFLENNHLIDLDLSGLTQLKKVSLRGNYFVDFPRVPAGCNLIKGEQKKSTFDVFLRIFPEAMHEKMGEDWQDEKKIDLSHYGQSHSALPTSFWQRIADFGDKVKVLNLSGNKLNTLPQAIGALALTHLYLQDCGLLLLPDALVSGPIFQTLEVFDIAYNPIKLWPQNSQNLVKVQKVIVSADQVEGHAQILTALHLEILPERVFE